MKGCGGGTAREEKRGVEMEDSGGESIEGKRRDKKGCRTGETLEGKRNEEKTETAVKRERKRNGKKYEMERVFR